MWMGMGMVRAMQGRKGGAGDAVFALTPLSFLEIIY